MDSIQMTSKGCGLLIALIVCGCGATSQPVTTVVEHQETTDRAPSMAADLPWVSQQTCTEHDLLSLWGSGPTDVFAVARHDAVLHFDGRLWVDLPIDNREPMHAIWGSGADDGIVVGSGGTVLRWRGDRWTADESETSRDLRAVWGSSEGVFAAGQKGVIIRWDGNAWSRQPSGTTVDLQGLWGSGPTNVFAVGSEGTIIRYDGRIWIPEQSGTTQDLHAIWGSSPSSVYAVGKAGTIIHGNGERWSPMTSGIEADLFGVWGSNEGGTEILAVGREGTIISWNGASWIPLEGGTSEDLLALWGTKGGAFVAGDAGTVLHRGAGSEGLDNDAEQERFQVTAELPDESRLGLLIFSDGEAIPENLSGEALDLEGLQLVTRGNEAWVSPTKQGGSGAHYQLAAAWPRTLPAGHLVPLLGASSERDDDDDTITVELPFVFRADQFPDQVIGLSEQRATMLPVVSLGQTTSTAEGASGSQLLRYARLCPEVRYREWAYNGDVESLMAMEEPPLPPGGWVFEPMTWQGPPEERPSGDWLITFEGEDDMEIRVYTIERPGNVGPYEGALSVWLVTPGGAVVAFHIPTHIPDDIPVFGSPHSGGHVFRRGNHIYAWMWFQERWVAGRVFDARRLEPLGEPITGRALPVDPAHYCNRTVCAASICPVSLSPTQLGVVVMDEGPAILFQGDGATSELELGSLVPVCGVSAGDELDTSSFRDELLTMSRRGSERCIPAP